MAQHYCIDLTNDNVIVIPNDEKCDIFCVDCGNTFYVYKKEFSTKCPGCEPVEKQHEEFKKNIDPREKYFPGKTGSRMLEWLREKKCTLEVVKDRKTLNGDYSPADRKIKINEGLVGFRFLITFLHEFAHVNATDEGIEDSHTDCSSHGRLWKNYFSKLLINECNKYDTFPEELLPHVYKYAQDITATTPLFLTNAIKQYENPDKKFTSLRDIPEGAKFLIPNKEEVYVKGPKLRTFCKIAKADMGLMFYKMRLDAIVVAV